MSVLLRQFYRAECVLSASGFVSPVSSPGYTRPPVRHLFYQKDKKLGYETKSKDPVTNLQHIRLGFQELKAEIKLWKEEVKQKFTGDPLIYYQTGVVDYVWDFTKQSDLDQFVCTSDSDHNEGKSFCTFEMSKAGRGLFSGELNTTVPKDGKIRRAGYCNIRSIRYRKSFKRDACYDWTMYNTLVLKVRGDGRPYMLNLSTEGYFDITWNDIYQYILYTRGGPYWQIVKIPISKFFLASRGRIQDKQMRLPLNRVTHFGISCGQKISGPFSLEIEHVGLEFDPQHNEEFAYELYKTDKLLTQN